MSTVTITYNEYRNFLHAIGSLTQTMCFEISVAIGPSVKQKMSVWKNIPHAQCELQWRICDAVGHFLSQRPSELCQTALHHKVFDTTGNLKQKIPLPQLYN